MTSKAIVVVAGGRPLWAKLAIAVCLGLGVCFGLQSLISASNLTSSAAGSEAGGAKKLHATPIERIAVGHRVLGRNPEVSDAQRDAFVEPDAETWRTIRLRMTKETGGRLDVTLLRPLEWIEAVAAKIGGTIELDLPEMGAVGPAEVLEIGPCPPIKPGRGNVVTGTFAHQSADVIDLRVSDQSTSIGCTSNHRFWSVDRGEFIEAGQLRVGERLDTPNGLVSVVSLTPRIVPESVYNIEVLGEHVYRVGECGMLVHNAYGKVYRGLSELDDISKGIFARAPGEIAEPIQHVAGLRNSPWISTTKNLAVAIKKYGKYGVVEIDLSKVRSTVLDISEGINGHTKTMMSNWAKKDMEVLIKDHIPAEAIKRIF